MNGILEAFENQPLVSLFGWTLIHFVWQAALIALFVSALLQCLQRCSAQVRYIVSCAGLALMALAPIGTLTYLANTTPELSPPTAAPQLAAATPSQDVTEIRSEGPTLDPTIPAAAPSNTAESGNDATSIDSQVVSPLGEPAKDFDLTALLGIAMPWLVAGWFLGASLLSLRLLLGLLRVRRWKTSSSPIGHGAIHQSFTALAQKMNCQRVRLLSSTHVAVPAVIGWLKPVILIPSSMVSGLTTAELESILAHEMAHIQRYDYLVNLLQSVAETLLFYHPAVWWISQRIRFEREFCCDDRAAEVCGSAKAIALALARMEEFRCANDPLVMAANGGSLVVRIQRLVTGRQVQSSSWWPAGMMAIATLAVLTLGLSFSPGSTVDAREANPDPIVDPLETPEDEDDYATRKSEIVKTDSKTGIEKRVFTDIELTTVRDERTRKAPVEMMYSNVLMHTFIPADVATALGAIPLGEIDFGATNPARKSPVQTGVGTMLLEPPPSAASEYKTMTVHEVMKPIDNKPLERELELTTQKLAVHQVQLAELETQLGAGHPRIKSTKSAIEAIQQAIKDIRSRIVKIVPYDDEPLWAPGHLGFYGMNQTKQHVFQVVRIEKVDLGIGPAFGPINALVLNEENSEFGVLGRDWAQQVRGNKGETLWFHADGTFHLMAGPKRPKQTISSPKSSPPPPRPVEDIVPKQEPGSMTVTSTPSESIDPRDAMPDIKVLKTWDYNLSRRVSKDWILKDGVRIPVDDGIQWDGVTVYLSMMFDVLAVDADQKIQWEVPWRKTDPIWSTVSIVQWIHGDQTRTAVELFNANRNTGALHYQYHDLKTGEKLASPKPPAREPTPNEMRADLPRVHIDNQENGQVKRAYINSIGREKTATRILEDLGRLDDDPNELSGSVTQMESIVSAYPRYLLGHGMDANEIVLSLPENSRTRAVFTGDRVEITQQEDSVKVIVTRGKVELLGPGSITRATASADGGAERLVVICRRTDDEVDLILRTQKPDDAEEAPPVQIRMNIDTGAPSDETEPPHGSIRYEIIPEKKAQGQPAQMKIKRHYGLRQLAAEAKAESEDRDQRPMTRSHQTDEGPKRQTDQDPRQQTESDTRKKPLRVRGRVTDPEGHPIEGVTIKAHSGVGTLWQTGLTTTDKNGAYDLHFSPGLITKDPKTLQSATISASLAGHCERNLYRQGDLIVALKKPDSVIQWGDKTEDDLILPNQPRTVDFVMVPATSIRGTVIQDGKPQEGMKVTLTGDQLPPSSSVIGSTSTNEKGEFAFSEVPVGFDFQIVVEPKESKPPWRGWATPPIHFLDGKTNDTHIRFSMDGKPVDFSFQQIQLMIDREGTNWRKSLKAASQQPLDLKWNGLSTNDMIRASTVSLDLD